MSRVPRLVRGASPAAVGGPLVVALSLLVPVAAASSPGEQAPPDRLRFHGESSVAWVLVPVVVRGPSGQVKDLQAGDFRLWVDDRPIPVAGFEAGADAPVRLIYLQDLSGSMATGDKLEASRQALRFFLKQMQGGDEIALVTFASGQTRLAVPFTGHPARLEEALAAWRGHGSTALYDAVAWLPEIRIEDRSVKRAALVVTDGGDNASTIAPARAREIVRAAELPVYVLDLRTDRRFRTAARQADQTLVGSLLRRLAAATGGQHHVLYGDLRSAAPGSRLNEICAAISQDLRYQYVLGFPTHEVGPREYRRIRVEVAAKNVAVSHRRGYLGLPPHDS